MNFTRVAATLAALTPSIFAHAAPTLVDDLYTPDAAVFSVAAPGFLANDISVAGGLVATLIQSVVGGVVTAFPNGSFTFTPSDGRATDASFQYQATDNSGGASIATVNFDMTSTLPFAKPDSYTLTTPVLNVPAGTGFLVNDTGGIGTVKATLISDSVDHGVLTAFPDGNFTYTPDSGFAGVDAFTYRISDEVGRTSEATVTIDASTNLPVAIDDVYAVAPDLAFSAAVPGFLANDSGGIGALKAILISDSVDHGVLTAFGDGHFNYIPDAGFIGIDSFRYQIADDVGRTAEALVRLLVGVEDPDPPGPVTPAPEPGTIALLLFGATAAIGSARRRREG